MALPHYPPLCDMSIPADKLTKPIPAALFDHTPVVHLNLELSEVGDYSHFRTRKRSRPCSSPRDGKALSDASVSTCDTAQLTIE